MRKTRIKKLSLNIALMVFTFVILFAFSELILHLVISKPFTCNIYEADSLLVFKNRANMNYTAYTSEYSANYITNNLGLREEVNDTPSRSSNDLIILTLGDSFTFGSGLNNNETFQEIVERKFDRVNKNVTVINAGVNGYGTKQSSLFLESNIQKINPDIVLFGFYNNDVQDDLNYESFVVENGCLISTDTAPLKKYLYFNSRIYLLYLSAKNYLIYDVKPIKNTLYSIRTFLKHANLSSGAKINYLIFYKNEPEDILTQWPKSLDNIRYMNGLCKKNDCIFVLMYIPSRIQIDLEYREDYLNRNKINLEDINLTRTPLKLGDLTKNEKILYINLYNEFAEKLVDNNRTKIYFSTDQHFNNVGSEIVGSIIFESLKNISRKN